MCLSRITFPHCLLEFHQYNPLQKKKKRKDNFAHDELKRATVKTTKDDTIGIWYLYNGKPLQIMIYK